MATLQCSRCGGTRYDTSHRCEKGCGVMTASNEVESLRERLEKVEAERDELSRDWDSEHYHRLAVERDRDALAAHVARSSKAIGVLLDYAPDEVFEEMKFEEWSPRNSLARRDARVKAEALEALANSLNLSFDRNIISKNGILEKAAEYRQQAEGGGDE